MHRYRQLLPILVTLYKCFTQVFTLPIIDPKIAQTLQTANETTLIITFLNSQYDKIIEPYGGGRSEKKFSSREERLAALYKDLSQHAEQLHAATLQVIKGIQRPGGQNPYEFYSMWASTHLIVQNADKALMHELSKSHEIAKIRQEDEFEVDFPPDDDDETKEKKGMPRQIVNWGVTSMGCQRVWETGNRGKGIVIGFIDTGVNPDHEALKDNFRSHYGWFEPKIFSKRPFDLVGHGTAVASAAVGTKNELGCAPEAQWIACQDGIKSGSERQGNARIKENSVAQCLNFLSCPTDTDGKNPNCSLAPKVVSASIGYRPNDGHLDPYLKTLKKQNIVVIASMGNSGPKCSTGFYPGDSEFTIGVGSITTDETVFKRSSRGPTVNNKTLIKPDVVAPGAKILVAAAGKGIKNNSYKSASGTSYAVPQVSALAALYFHDFPTATVDDFRTHLINSARAVHPSGTDCGGIRQGEYPNFVAGYGAVDAFHLINLAHGRKSTATQLFRSETEIIILATGFVCLLQPFVFT